MNSSTYETAKGLAFIFLGMLFGVAVSQSYFKSKYQKIADEEISVIKEKLDEFKDTAKEPGPIVVDQDRSVVSGNKYSVMTREYSDPNQDVTATNSDSNEDSSILIINFDEFANEYPHHFKLALTYYELDGILANDQDEIVDDVSRLLGENVMNSFGDDPEDPYSVYVRNFSEGADYEITKVSSGYGETVIGGEDV